MPFLASPLPLELSGWFTYWESLSLTFACHCLLLSWPSDSSLVLGSTHWWTHHLLTIFHTHIFIPRQTFLRSWRPTMVKYWYCNPLLPKENFFFPRSIVSIPPVNFVTFVEDGEIQSEFLLDCLIWTQKVLNKGHPCLLINFSSNKWAYNKVSFC